METPPSAGRYRIDRLLGSGAFAVVYLGHDAELNAPVAIKVLAEHWARREDVRERFVQEARLLRRVDSHRLVQVFDIGALPDGRPYFVMTYADRGTVEDRLAAGPLPVGEALRLAREVARALADLHEAGIVHRDVKPSNVLLHSGAGRDERVMISDLGIARTGDRLSSLTLPAGSPGYMAPEQAVIDGAPDHRADVFGLGALTYHLLTGEPPREDPPSPGSLRPGVPPSVDAVVLRALSPDRNRRWASAVEFEEALSRTTSRIDTDPLPDSRPRRFRRHRRRRILLAAAALALAAAGGTGTLLVVNDGGTLGLAHHTGGNDAGPGDPNGRWLRTDRDIPAQYRRLIVRAGTWCQLKGLSPALIAAMLKVESGFDPNLSDPVKDEYGIARWTPHVLTAWQPGGLNNPEPRLDDITPDLSIPAMGRFLCYWGKDLTNVPGDPAQNLAATYRTSSKRVVAAKGPPPKYRTYCTQVARYVAYYRPS
ncbi:serine/threonine-protein kinase [Actinomadura oligospora]|uniref:serine/threonine-protein kinase n=1 Tax=Actinomadura oligospora TaxID=111804 RepID=UPI0004B419E1|nr:serine/threonine-protein kinase [Actinomadura oligospora]